MHYILIWVQASWKWTQARLLVENYWFVTFSTWDELRRNIREKTELWKEVEDILARWELVDDKVIEKIVGKFLEDDTTWKVLFDGIPRNLEQAKMFNSLVKDYKVILFKLDVEKAKARVLGRMYDAETQETFPAWSTVNPKNGNILEKRNDDADEEALAQRIEIFFEDTMPIVDALAKEWRVIEINADQPIEDVHAEVVNKLEL